MYFYWEGKEYKIDCDQRYEDDVNTKLNGHNEYLKRISSAILNINGNFQIKYAGIHTRAANEPTAIQGGPAGECCSFVFNLGGYFFVRLRVQNSVGNNNSWWFFDRDENGIYDGQRTKGMFFGRLLDNGNLCAAGEKELFNRLIKFFGERNQEEVYLCDNIKGADMHINLIKYGPPGTGKTYSLVKSIKDILCIDREIILNNVHSILKSELYSGRVEFVTFHQSFSYEEFVEGIRAEVNDSGQVGYFVRNGIFKRICRRAYFYKVKEIIENIDQDKAYNKDDGCKRGELFSQDALQAYENMSTKQFARNFSDLYQLLEDYQIDEHSETVEIPKFVLCIDEINRANISRVLGELITLIEDNKRQGAKDAISLTLPYSGEEFFVPDNLFIIGTMNTSDHSLAKLDVALRRRFYFEKCYPDLEKLNGLSVSKGLLEGLNNFLQSALDKEHTIGHSYLMDSEDNLEKIYDVFRMKIIPLLEEYFLSNPDKVKEALNKTGLSDDVIEKLLK